MMVNGRTTVLTCCALLVLAVAGCSSEEAQPGGSTVPSASPTQTVSALQRAEAALLTSAELPPAPPGILVDAGSGYTAEGDQVSAPWTQVWLCAGTSRPDEGPPAVVEPGALAGAWGFGRAGVAQVDQYAIVYQDESAAEAAVARSRDQADMCRDAITGNPEYYGDPPTVEVGAVPSSVDGVRVTATFTDDAGKSDDMVSTVMRVGSTVHFMRFNEMSAYESASGETEQNPDTMLDPQYVEELIDAAAAGLSS